MRRRLKKKKIVFLVGGLACFLIMMLMVRKNIYRQSYETYCEYLMEEENTKNFQENKARCYLIRINRDWIPELFVCDGDYSMSSMRLYSIGDNGEVEWIQNLSSMAKIHVFRNPFKGVTKSQYGGHGFFFDVYSEFSKENTLITIGANASDGTGLRMNGVLNYVQFPVPDDLEQNQVDFDFFHLDTKYLVSDEEFARDEKRILRNAGPFFSHKVVTYEDMIEMDLFIEKGTDIRK